MSDFVFCTRCGTRGDAQSAFCENCGTALRKADALPQQPAAAATHVAPSGARPRKLVVGAALVVGALATAVAVFFFAGRAPAATPSALLAAAKAAYGPPATASLQRELCLSNLDYSKDRVLISEWDRGSRDAMDTLVAAGLYGAPETVQSGGFVAQTLLQYTPTPELAKYRDGRLLCLAQNVEIAGVADVGTPAEQRVGAGAGTPGILTVDGTLLLRSVGTAQWLENAQVRNALLPSLRGWEYREQSLHKRVPEWFGVREGRWATGPAYRAELDRQLRAAPRRDAGAREAATAGSSLWASIQRVFHASGSHPLRGRWRMAGGRVMGMDIPEGFAPDITFTADRMESGGVSTQARFEVDGDKVRVTAEGEPSGAVFVMEGSDLMRVEATGMRYRRVQ